MTDQAKECAAMQEQIVLQAYGELPDEQRHRLESHVRTCEECAAELTKVQALRQLMQALPVQEPSASLLASARMRLDEALDQMPAVGRVGRLRQALSAWGFHLRAVPALATMLLVVGAAGGGLAGWQVSQHAAAHAQLQARGFNGTENANAPGTPVTPANLPEGIANISGVASQPGSNLVQVRYNRLVPGTVEGTTDDPRIQQLLLLATQNRANPGVRVDSVGLLADECQAGKNCGSSDNGASVRQALMAALRYDKNAGVRLKALDGLSGYVSTDEAVRNSVLQALLHDDNPGVRTQAIQMLSPVEADGSVREVLHTLANDDRNPYIRTVSQQALESGPEIQ
jgi:hypothetical protein